MRVSFVFVTFLALFLNSNTVLGKMPHSRLQQASSWARGLFSPVTVRTVAGVVAITITACTSMLGCSESNNPLFGEQSEEGRYKSVGDRPYYTFASTGEGKQLSWDHYAMGIQSKYVSYYEQNREGMTVADYSNLFVHYRKNGLDFAGSVSAKSYVDRYGDKTIVGPITNDRIERSVVLTLHVSHFDSNPYRVIHVDDVVGIYVTNHADYDLGRVYMEWNSSAATTNNDPSAYFSLSSPPPLTWVPMGENLKFSGVVGIAFTSDYNILVVDTVEDSTGKVWILEDYERFPLAVSRASLQSVSP